MAAANGKRKKIMELAGNLCIALSPEYRIGEASEGIPRIGDPWPVSRLAVIQFHKYLLDGVLESAHSLPNERVTPPFCHFITGKNIRCEDFGDKQASRFRVLFNKPVDVLALRLLQGLLHVFVKGAGQAKRHPRNRGEFSRGSKQALHFQFPLANLFLTEGQASWRELFFRKVESFQSALIVREGIGEIEAPIHRDEVVFCFHKLSGGLEPERIQAVR